MGELKCVSATLTSQVSVSRLLIDEQIDKRHIYNMLGDEMGRNIGGHIGDIPCVLTAVDNRMTMEMVYRLEVTFISREELARLRQCEKELEQLRMFWGNSGHEDH